MYASTQGYLCAPNGYGHCHLVEVAPSGWSASAVSKLGRTGNCTVGQGDPVCAWTEGALNVSKSTLLNAEDDIGVGLANYASLMTGTNGTLNSMPFELSRAYQKTGAMSEQSPFDWSLPTLEELRLVCNYANQSPLLTTKCTKGKGLLPGFTAGPYWSSTLKIFPKGDLPVAVNFADGTESTPGFSARASVRPVYENAGIARSLSATTTVQPPVTSPSPAPPPTIPRRRLP